MDTKKAVSGNSDVNGETASDEVTVALKTIFASDSVPDSVRSWRERKPVLDLISAFIGDQFANVLGTAEARQPLGEATDRAIFIIVQSTATSLRHFDLTIEDAMTVVDRVCERIEMESGVMSKVDPSKSISDSEMKYTDAASRALNDLGFECVRYIIERTKKEIARLSLPDKVIEVQRRKRQGWLYKPYYEQTHNVLLSDLALEIDLERQRKKIHDAIQVDNPKITRDTIEGKDEYEPTRREKLLAEICPLFRDATPQIQQSVWSKLRDFTRKQWALFLIETDPTRKTYSSGADAVKGIIKPKAKTIDEISGLTNMRGISIVEGSEQYSKDLKKVNKIINILNADGVLRRNQFVNP